MKRLKGMIAGLACIVLLSGGVTIHGDDVRASATRADHVVILDIDGLRRDALYYLLAYEPESIPNLAKIVLGDFGKVTFAGRYGDVGAPVSFEESQAIGVNRGISVLPSSTFACQASLFTGYYPNQHGILGNEYFDRTIPGPGAQKRRGFAGGSLVGQFSGFPVQMNHIIGTYEYDAPDVPVLEREAAAQQNSCMDTCLDAINSASDISTDPSHPMYGGFANRNLLAATIYDQASRSGKKSLIAFNMYSSASYHQDANIQWIRPTLLDFCDLRCGRPLGEAYDVAMMEALVHRLRAIPQGQMPQIITAYFAGHDHAAHYAEEQMCYGEPCQLGYLKNVVDREIGKLIQALRDRGLYERTWFLITSDHGHTEVINDDQHAVINEDEMEDVIERYLGDLFCSLFDDCPFDVYDYNDWLSSGDDYGAYFAQNGGDSTNLCESL